MTLQTLISTFSASTNAMFAGLPIVVLGTTILGWLYRRSRRLRAVGETCVASRSSAGLSDRLTKKRLRILGTLMSDNNKLLPSDLRVEDLMTTSVRTAHPSTPVGTLRAIAVEHDIRHILICDDDNRLVGVVSDRDLRQVTGDVIAADLMMACPTTITSRSLVNNAISVLLYGHFSSLPVVDDGRLVGILTTTDVVMTLQCMMLTVERVLEDLDSGDGAHPAACSRT